MNFTPTLPITLHWNIPRPPQINFINFTLQIDVISVNSSHFFVEFEGVVDVFALVNMLPMPSLPLIQVIVSRPSSIGMNVFYRLFDIN